MPVPARRLFARATAVVAGFCAVGYGSAVAYLKLNEHGLIYIPAERRVPAPPAELALNERRVTYASTDGVTLSAWIVPAREDRRTGRWLLICHGNYGNIGFGGRPDYYARMRDLGLEVFAFDYRGFGESTGTPDEQGLYDDAAASYRYLTESLGVPAERIVIFGHSLGTGVAIELASRVKAGGLIVEAPYTSIVDVGQELYPLMPVSVIATQRFPSIDRIGSLRMPKLFLHSPEDDVIPYAHGERLFEAALEPKAFVAVRGGHDYAYRLDADRYFGAVVEFLRGVASAGAFLREPALVRPAAAS
jgi:fermentation-respiration switch protein FrsA (DUF1100 family)